MGTDMRKTTDDCGVFIPCLAEYILLLTFGTVWLLESY